MRGTVSIVIMVLCCLINSLNCSAVWNDHHGDSWAPESDHHHHHDDDHGHHSHRREHGHHDDHVDHDDWSRANKHADGWHADRGHHGDHEHALHTAYAKGDKNDWANYKYGGEGNHADGSAYSKGISKVYGDSHDDSFHNGKGWTSGGHHDRGHDDDQARHADWASHHNDHGHDGHHHGDQGSHNAGWGWAQK